MTDGLVVGTGLVGAAILSSHSQIGLAERAVVAWETPGAEASLAAQVRAFAAGRDRWTVYWAAGRSRTDSDRETIARESHIFRSMLLALCDGSIRHRGSVVLVSSGGGIQSKRPSAGPLEFHRFTHYAESKLLQESLLNDFVAETGHFGGIARLTNVYGFRPDGRPGTGLTTVLCRAALLGETCDITVPLNTTRNYIFARDAGSIVVASTHRQIAVGPLQQAGYVVAGPSNHSIREHIEVVERLTGREVKYRLTGENLTAVTPRQDTHLGSFIPPETVGRTSFEEGIAETLRSAFNFPPK